MSDTITLPREVVVQTVRVLSKFYDTWPKERNEAVAALRTALAAEPTKPHPLIPLHQSDCALLIGGYQCTCGFHQRQNKTPTALAAEQPKQEPVAWMDRFGFVFRGKGPHETFTIPLYTAPPATHPGYVIGSHWLETAYSRICAGEAEADVLRDCGWERVDDIEALRRDAERYRYLRNRDPKEVFNKSGKAAGVWIDWEDDLSGLQLLTGDDADAAIDAAMKEDER